MLTLARRAEQRSADSISAAAAGGVCSPGSGSAKKDAMLVRWYVVCVCCVLLVPSVRLLVQGRSVAAGESSEMIKKKEKRAGNSDSGA